MELQIQQLKNIYNHKVFWVLVTISCLATLHLYYVWKMSGTLPSLLDALGWLAVGFLLWKKKHRIKFNSGLISSIVGMFLIFWMMIRHGFGQYYLSKVDILAGLFPVITIVSVFLITTGWKRLVSYKSEIIVASLISIPYASLYNTLKSVVNIDAQLLNFMLHYIGLQSVRQGAIVSMRNGSVEINPSCSSVGPILTMLPLIVVLLSIYPTSKTKQFFIYIATIFSIIFINGIRLSSLVIFLDKGDLDSFKYWHEGGGAGIFSNIIVFLIGGISYQILNISSKSNPEKLDVNN